MSDYISRQAAIDGKISIQRANGVEIYTDEAVPVEHLKNVPAADVVPVVHSQWKYKCGEIQCPECGNRIHRIDLSGCLNFCPNCGAKMVE